MLCHDSDKTPNRIPPHRIPPPQIFLAFLRLGITAFGGPAMVPYIRDMVVKKNLWVSESSFRDGVGLCQSIPGATAMQTAAYSGLRAGGIRGALAAYVGFGLPAFLLMVVFSVAYATLHSLPVGVAIFSGLRAVVIALMANAVINFGQSSLKNWRDVLLAAATAVFLSCGGPPIFAIVATAVIAMMLYKGIDNPKHSDADATRDFQPRIGTLSIIVVPILAVAMVLIFILDHRLATLAALMVKIDLFAFGGGFASIPLMFHDVVQKRAWMSDGTFIDGIALGQVTPGPIVITATFVGYHVAGLVGAVTATIAIFTPSFLILLASVPYFDRWQKSLLFRRALRGALVCFVGLLFAVTVKFGFATPWGILSVMIALVAFTALRLGVDITWVVLTGVCVSAVLL
jgi:chromate transporter